MVAHVIGACDQGAGGWVVTPNVDICRQVSRDGGLRRLVASASLVVPDGMPLVWASRLRRSPLPERVAGGSLIFSLTEAAAARGHPVYLLGGAPGVPQQAAVRLRERYRGLLVAGTDAPLPGFDADPAQMAAIRDRIAAAGPAIVYVGMGFPKQERLIASLAPSFPATWFLGCGAAIGYAAGTLPRPPLWMRKTGLAWLFRLGNEPGRLFRRYLIQDAPFALALLAAAASSRLRRRSSPSAQRALADRAGVPGQRGQQPAVDPPERRA